MSESQTIRADFKVVQIRRHVGTSSNVLIYLHATADFTINLTVTFAGNAVCWTSLLLTPGPGLAADSGGNEFNLEFWHAAVRRPQVATESELQTFF